MIEIILGLVIAAVVGGVAVAFTLSWEDTKKAVGGKKVSVLGERGTGKSHLIQFFSKGSIPEKYKPTEGVYIAEGRKFAVRDLEMKIDLEIEKLRDVDGSPDAYDQWKRSADEADIILYLLRVDLLFLHDKATAERIIQDIKQIVLWIKSRSGDKPKLFILGTHCDRDPKYAERNTNKDNVYIDTFRKLPCVRELISEAGGISNVKIVLGSMKSLPDTEFLVFNLFMQIAALS